MSTRSAAQGGVLHINTRNDSASVGGELVAGLNAAGVEASLRQPTAHGVRFGRRWSYLYAPIRAMAVLSTAWQVRRRQPAVVHIHNARHALIGLLAGRPFVVHCHGTDIRATLPRRGWGWVVAPAMRRATLVLVSTPDLLEVARRYTADVHLLPNPISVDEFAAAAGSASRDVLIGVPLTETKGGDTVLAVATRLRALRPQTTFTVIDHGLDCNRLKEFFGTSVSVVPRANRPGLARLMHEHRLSLGQMRLGTPGVYELECLAAGLPVVMSAPWNRRSPDPAPLIDADPIDDMATLARDLLDDESARLAVAMSGAAWVRRWHDLPAVTKRLIDMYRAAGLIARGV